MSLTKDIIIRISTELSIPVNSVENTIELLSGGATIPFISRYRKEQTGSLDEVQVADVQKKQEYYSTLIKRKEYVLKTILDLGKLTDRLKSKIESSFDSNVIEDLFLPYKPKRKTKAVKAKEKGLEPLAEVIFKQNNSNVESLAAKFLTAEVETVDDALLGARHIMAEWISEDAIVREKIRNLFTKKAIISSRVIRGKKEEGQKFMDYFDFSEPLKKCAPHRVHAMLRGDKEGFLLVEIKPDEEQALGIIDRQFVTGHGDAKEQVQLAVEDAYDRLLQPSLEYEFRKQAKEMADDSAIDVFADNAKKLFLAPPLGQKTIIGIDPGFRTGCKVVVIDDLGNLKENTTIYPHPPQNKKDDAVYTIKHLVDKYDVEAMAVGDGTAGRETLALFNAQSYSRPVQVFMVNENGASIYSASDIAREEFPDYDVTVRGSVSIARRLMDPLAELVKIDPKSVGVGQYQHDVDQTKLKQELTRVVESCVNSVGINLNTASKHLLTYVSGLGPVLAQNIIDYRTTNGPFISRKSLKEVPRMGAKAFEQSAGFLRINEGGNPLDNTGVHPERYALVKQMAKDNAVTVEDLIKNVELRKQVQLTKYINEEVGLPTLQDIIKELDKPGLDPRGEVRQFAFDERVKTIEDLHEGLILPGLVTNVTNFGAFVNIGIKNEGLVHISHIANKFIKHPSEVLSVQDEVKVKVISVDLNRSRVQLSIKEAQ